MKPLDSNSFIDALNVWESPEGDIFILDGHHRQQMLDILEKDGYAIPEVFTCNFIECKDRKEAAKYLLIYSARDYARIQEEGLYEFMNTEDLTLEDFRSELTLPDIDLEYFEIAYFDNVDPYPEKPQKDNEGEEKEVKHCCPQCGFEW